MAFKIGDRAVGGGEPTYIVSETAWAHDGSVANGTVMIDASARAGADAINFHLTSLPNYMVPSYGAGPGRVSGGHEAGDIYKYLERINLSSAAVEELVDRARGRGLAISAMCNDEESLGFANGRLSPDVLMVHPSSVGDERLVRKLAAAGRPMVIYTGGLWLGEVESAIRWATAEGNEQLVLQHGFQSYPTALEDNNLRAIRTLKRQFGYPVAFADHTDGNDPMAMIVPLLAIAMGADLIEKHITYDREAKGEDYESALGPEQFVTFVQQVRKAEVTFGTASWHGLSQRELQYRSVVRKRAVAAIPVAAGTTLTRDAIAFKRAEAGLYPEEIAHLLDRVRVAPDLEANSPLTWESFS